MEWSILEVTPQYEGGVYASLDPPVYVSLPGVQKVKSGAVLHVHSLTFPTLPSLILSNALCAVYLD